MEATAAAHSTWWDIHHYCKNDPTLNSSCLTLQTRVQELENDRVGGGWWDLSNALAEGRKASTLPDQALPVTIANV